MTLSRDMSAWRPLCGVVAALIPTLDWRHSGLGVLQAYVHEGTEAELRVHIWHKSLRRAGIEASGLYHDHRFDMTSTVLYGTITQEEIEITQLSDRPDAAVNTKPVYCLYEVLHARAAKAKTGRSFHELPQRLSAMYTRESRLFDIPAGQAYFQPKRTFHGTWFRDDMAITVITKSAQDERPARILAPWDKPLVHAFSDPLPREQWQDILAQAKLALVTNWRGGNKHAG